jgi:pyruvate kinase
MDYEIVATLGPSSQTEVRWSALLSAGATAFRLNTSYLSLEQLGDWLEKIQRFQATLPAQLSVVLDLQSSKWRLGDFPSLEWVTGQRVRLVHAASSNQPSVLPVPHADFFRAAPASNGEIVLNDAKVRLAALSMESDYLLARVVKGGELSAHKGITLPSSDYRQEALQAKDRAILEQTSSLPFIRYAISYVRDAIEMDRYRALFGPQPYLIAKIERQPAAREALEIAQHADELWLCRGDLGAELGMKAMAETVHGFAEIPGRSPVPVLLAGQVLEHMVAHPEPTRSEVNFLYEALCQGYAGVVLSDETAIGDHPIESCRVAALFKDTRVFGCKW